MKYSNQDVVRNKREIEILSKDLARLGSERNLIKDEIYNLRVSLDQSRKKVKSLVEELSLYYQELKTRFEGEISALNNEIDILLSKRKREEELYNNTSANLLLRRNESIDKEKVASEKTRIANAQLDSILNKINAEMLNLNNLTNINAQKEEKVLSLKEQEKSLLSRIAQINDEIEKTTENGKKVNQSLIEERDKLRKKIENGRDWERNIKAMEARLSPEYKAVYKKLPNRKHPNGL